MDASFAQALSLETLGILLITLARHLGGKRSGRGTKVGWDIPLTTGLPETWESAEVAEVVEVTDTAEETLVAGEKFKPGQQLFTGPC